MKTTTNNQRKNSKLIMILMMISLISTNGFAQLAFMNQSLNENQKSIYTEGKSEIISAFSDFNELGSYEGEFIEEWMMTPFEWRSGSESFLSLMPESFVEEDVEFECWMMEPVWIITSEEDITIETWMADPFDWAKEN